MGVCFLYGNGGNGEKDRLNFRVLGGMTAPENPQENYIWVQTDVAISGAELFPITPTWQKSEGWVYIQTVPATGAARPNFNATKLTGSANDIYLWLQLSGAVQQISGTWVRLNGWIYHDDGWHQFSSTQYTIFNAGGATDYSGGWNAYAYKSQSSGSTPKAPTFSVGATFNIDLYGQYEYNMGTVFSEAAIDLTKYSTLVIEVASTQTGGAYGGFSCGVCAAKQNNWTPAATATDVSAGTHTIDISALSGSYYLSLSLGGVAQGVTGKASITRIYLK